jgi:DNA-directed RNA polymerase alpha subunit
MSKIVRSADQQMAGEVAGRALHPVTSRQKISDSQSAPEFEENHKRLRAERLARESEEMTELAPTPELPDETPTRGVNFPLRIKNALFAAGLKTVGEVRELSDEDLLRLPHFGKGSVIQLRTILGLPSTEGVRPGVPKK